MPHPDSSGHDRSDSDLAGALARTALGDHAAFRRVYELSHRQLLGVAMRVMGRRDLGEEVLQEVFVAVWHRAPSYQAATARPKTWLRALVRHRAIDLRRSRSRSELEYQTTAMQDAGEQALERAATAGRDFDLAVARRQLAPCMATLAGPQRQCLALAYYDGLSQSEVAQQLAVPLGSVKTWVRRGLAQLRRCLTPGAPA